MICGIKFLSGKSIQAPMRLFVLILAVFVLVRCKPTVATSGSTAGGKYAEDLSSLRVAAITPVDTARKSPTTASADSRRDPSHYVEARHAINTSIDAVLDSIDRINLSRGVIDGFTIQLYSGVSREEALDVKKQISTAMPEMDSDVQFVQPNFRVRAGKYVNRFDAQKDFMSVKKIFPNAVIIPDRIPIR
jgi:hypothetical protein